MAKEAIDFSGNNCATDSYNSNLGPYGGVNIGDKGDVASNWDLLNVGNADIKGVELEVQAAPIDNLKLNASPCRSVYELEICTVFPSIVPDRSRETKSP